MTLPLPYQNFDTQEKLISLGVDPCITQRGVTRRGKTLFVRIFLGNRFVCYDQNENVILLTSKEVKKWFS